MSCPFLYNKALYYLVEVMALIQWVMVIRLCVLLWPNSEIATGRNVTKVSKPLVSMGLIVSAIRAVGQKCCLPVGMAPVVCA